MGKLTSMAFWLILVLILVAYYKGTSSVAGTFGTQISNLVKALQGRNSNGSFANYPTQK